MNNTQVSKEWDKVYVATRFILTITYACCVVTIYNCCWIPVFSQIRPEPLAFVSFLPDLQLLTLIKHYSGRKFHFNNLWFRANINCICTQMFDWWYFLPRILGNPIRGCSLIRQSNDFIFIADVSLFILLN